MLPFRCSPQIQVDAIVEEISPASSMYLILTISPFVYPIGCILRFGGTLLTPSLSDPWSLSIKLNSYRYKVKIFIYRLRVFDLCIIYLCIMSIIWVLWLLVGIIYIESWSFCWSIARDRKNIFRWILQLIIEYSQILSPLPKKKSVKKIWHLSNTC